MKSGARIVAVVLLLLAGAAGVADTRQDGDRLLARAYEVRYRPLVDVAELIDPLLSEDGTMTLRPRLKTLVVEDRVSVLDRVGALLESYDLPPRNVEVTFSLFLGTDRRDEQRERVSGGTGLSSDVRGVLETLSDVTKWSSYDPLGSRSVTGAEGDEVVAILSEDYRVVFAVESVHEGHGVIKFKQLTLQQLRREEDGTTVIDDLYTASLAVSTGKLTVVGAARDPSSKRALFITFQARPKPR